MVKLQPINRSDEKFWCFQKRFLIQYCKISGGGRSGTFSPTSLRDNWSHPLSPPSKRPCLHLGYNIQIKWKWGLFFVYFVWLTTSWFMGPIVGVDKVLICIILKKDGMPANVNKNKLGTKNTTPGLRCQERIHQSNLFSGKEWYCAINLSYIEEWHCAIYLSFSKESYCTVLPIYCIIKETAENRAWPPRSSRRLCLLACVHSCSIEELFRYPCFFA